MYQHRRKLEKTTEFVASVCTDHSHNGGALAIKTVPSSVIISLVSVGLYLLFDKAMDVPLPLGLLDVLED